MWQPGDNLMNVFIEESKNRALQYSWGRSETNLQVLFLLVSRNISQKKYREKLMHLHCPML